MFNLLSGEFYKWRKSKSFKVCCLVIIVFIIFLYGSLLSVQKIQNGEMENDSMGMNMSMNVDMVASVDVMDLGIVDMEQAIFASVAAIVSAVFVSIFVVGEYGNGAVKNIVGKGIGRSGIFLAKYITTILAVVVMELISATATLLGDLIVFGVDSINVEIMKDLFQYVGIQLLLGAAFAGFVVAIGELSRSMAVGIAGSIGLFTVGSLLFSGLDLFFHGLDFKPSNYWVVNLMNECPLNDIGRDFAMRAVLVAVVWIVVSGAVGLLHFKKADVK